MGNTKRPISLLLKNDTADLLIELYKKDCPNREHSLSYWVDNILLVALRELEMVE